MKFDVNLKIIYKGVNPEGLPPEVTSRSWQAISNDTIRSKINPVAKK